MNNLLHPDSFDHIYFVGIGGIGMSALARYFNHMGKKVAGYDRTSTDLTVQLENEGIAVHYADALENIPADYLNNNTTLVVYTPAIPADSAELNYFQQNGFQVAKRSVVLGMITRKGKSICIAGTHGKTTTTTMTAHLLKQSSVGCHAFLGGVSQNYGTNLLISDDLESPTVIEADEFDRSFLQLSPTMAVITWTDADHLDIYGDASHVTQAFADFASRISENGVLLLKKGIELPLQLQTGVKVYSYAREEKADFYASDVKNINGFYQYRFHSPFGTIENLQLGVPGLVNLENSIAASAFALLNGVTADELRNGLATFKGIKRRFEFYIRTDKMVYIDDYAHHPREIEATAKAVRALYPDKKLTVVFQPHLFTRTRDFADDFAQVLSHFNQVVLLDIYPAREKPIPGITSQMLLNKVTSEEKILVTKTNLIEQLHLLSPEVLITMGAGDISDEVSKIAKAFEV